MNFNISIKVAGSKFPLWRIYPERKKLSDPECESDKAWDLVKQILGELRKMGIKTLQSDGFDHSIMCRTIDDNWINIQSLKDIKQKVEKIFGILKQHLYPFILLFELAKECGVCGRIFPKQFNKCPVYECSLNENRPYQPGYLNKLGIEIWLSPA